MTTQARPHSPGEHVVYDINFGVWRINAGPYSPGLFFVRFEQNSGPQKTQVFDKTQGIFLKTQGILTKIRVILVKTCGIFPKLPENP